jgi:hypothetical protein
MKIILLSATEIVVVIKDSKLHYLNEIPKRKTLRIRFRKRVPSLIALRKTDT